MVVSFFCVISILEDATKSNILSLKVDLINIKIYKKNRIYEETQELSQINMLLTKF